MKKMTKIMTGFLSLSMLAMTAAETVTFGDRPGLFTDQQTVTMQTSANAKLTIVNRAGLTRQLSADAAGAVNAGKLPAGYYEIFDAAKVELGKFVIVPAVYPNDQNSRLGVDYALGSAPDLPADRTLRRELIERNAAMAKLAGVRHVRERLNLNRGVKKMPDGKIAVDDFAGLTAVQTAKNAGFTVCAMFQNMPPWVNQAKRTLQTPDSLTDTYNIMAAVGDYYGKYFDDIEIYNEIDLQNFYEGTASEYLAFAKTAILALRQHAPHARILAGSFATPADRYFEILKAGGYPGYVDLDNFHSYSAHEGLQQYLARQINRVTHPAVATEIGVHIPPWKALDAVDYPEEISREIANNIGDRYAEALAAGSERAYFFLWRFYTAVGSILDRNYQPTERLAALATANFAMGNGNYQGTAQVDGLRLHMFDNTFGRRCLVLPPGNPGHQLEIKTAGDWQCYESTGELLKQGTGIAAVETGAGTRYLTAPQILIDVKDLRAAGQPRAVAAAAPVVMDLRFSPKPPYDRALCAYEFAPGQTLQAELFCHNFGKTPYTGSIAVTAPGNWQVILPDAPVSVGPGEMIKLPVSITAPAERTAGRQDGIIVWQCGDSAHAVRVALAAKELTPAKTAPAFAVPVNQLVWQTNAFDASLLTPKITATPGGIDFKVDFISPGQRMFWPTLKTLPHNAKVLDWSGYDGLLLDLDVKSTRPGTWFMVSLTEPAGSRYHSNRIVIDKPGKAQLLLLFSDFVYFDSVPDEPLFSLDIDQIARFGLGFHTLSEFRGNFQENYTVEYELTGATLVKY